jgi:hypothetical protein
MATDRKGFRFHQDTAYWFFTIDRPIHRVQVNRFDAEFDEAIDEIFLKPRSKEARLTKQWRNHLDTITHDGYGSFRLDFDDEMENYSDTELESFNEDIFEIVSNLPIIYELYTWINIEEDIDHYIANSGIENTMSYYIDSVLDCKYQVDQRDVGDLFNPENDATISQMIANEFLVRKLKDQNVVCRDVA